MLVFGVHRVNSAQQCIESNCEVNTANIVGIELVNSTYYKLLFLIYYLLLLLHYCMQILLHKPKTTQLTRIVN